MLLETKEEEEDITASYASLVNTDLFVSTLRFCQNQLSEGRPREACQSSQLAMESICHLRPLKSN